MSSITWLPADSENEICCACLRLDEAFLLEAWQAVKVGTFTTYAEAIASRVSVVGATSGAYCDDSENDYYEELGYGYTRRNSCIRWACRCVAVNETEVIEIYREEYGGVTTNGLDIITTLAIPLMGAETETGCYLYMAFFEGWQERKRKEQPEGYARGWVSKDDCYVIYRYKII